jgi:GTP cyclohydrolase I
MARNIEKIIKKMKIVEYATTENKPSKEEAKEAVRTLLKWIGEDPDREGLVETPERVLKSYESFFAGYSQDPSEMLHKTFNETAGFDDMVLLDKISFSSFCEHHMLPIEGKVSVAYIPDGKVVGISKLARVVDVFAKRLQLQERMTVQIAKAVNKHLNPKGVAVFVSASHRCMTIRGVNKNNSEMKTSYFIGEFSENIKMQKRFLMNVK